MAKENTKRSVKSKNIDPMDQAFEAFRELPKRDEYHPEGCFTRKEFQDSKFRGSRSKADRAIQKLLDAGLIAQHEHVGTGGARYYYFVG